MTFLPLVSHSWKVTAPMRLVTRLPPQGKQVVRPTSDWYVPSGHSIQGMKPSREYWPGEHWPEHTHLAKSEFKFVRQHQWIRHKYNGQQDSADSSCLVLQERWDLRSSPKVTEGEKNMVAPLTQELLNSNTSSSSKLQRLWIYTKRNICQTGDLYRATDTSCVVHVCDVCYSFCICVFGFQTVFFWKRHLI